VARLRSWVEHLSDVIVVLDDHLEIVYTSPAIAHIIDAPPETNVGQNALNDIHPDDLAMVAQVLAELAASPTGTTVQVDLRLEARPGSGQWRWVEATAVNRLADPAVGGIVCTLRDVTEQRAAAAELQAAYDRERSVSERLRELDRLKDDFLATVSHELRTPLSVIVGFSDLLQRADVERSVSDEAVERIRSCAVEMRGMVENLLAFSALEAGRVAVSPVRLSLAAAVATTVNRMAPLLAGHDLTIDVPADLVASADPDGFEAVLRNLLTNAAKYSAPGSPISVRGSAADGTVALEVEDHGAGIAPDQLELVFERLYRAPGAAFLGRGTGVGLNAARRYAELMGGTVSVRSARGVGSTFTVTLPAAR
jgi:PAS domain S-box-containing protein